MYDFPPMCGGRSDRIKNRTWKVLLRMRTSNREIKLPVAYVHFEKNLHSASVRGRFKPYIPCTIMKSIVCNTRGRTLPTRVKFATRAVVSSSARAENFTHLSGIALIPHFLHNILSIGVYLVQNASLTSHLAASCRSLIHYLRTDLEWDRS